MHHVTWAVAVFHLCASLLLLRPLSELEVALQWNCISAGCRSRSQTQTVYGQALLVAFDVIRFSLRELQCAVILKQSFYTRREINVIALRVLNELLYSVKVLARFLIQESTQYCYCDSFKCIINT